MSLSLTVPAFIDPAAIIQIIQLYMTTGTEVRPGGKLFDVRVDLSAAAVQDCPVVTYYRVTSLERAWVRQVQGTVGSQVAVGDLVALLSATADEAIDAPPSRTLRVSKVGILHVPDWLGEG